MTHMGDPHGFQHIDKYCPSPGVPIHPTPLLSLEGVTRLSDSSIHTFDRCEALGDNIVHTFSDNCSPVSHIFLVITVKHVTVQQVSS